jgi:hypothetical protein
MYRKDIISQVGHVEREYRAAAVAVSNLLRQSQSNPTLLQSTNIIGADLRICRDNLDDTYLVRMFAVFEESLRQMRKKAYRRDSLIKTRDLLNQCAARQHVPSDHLIHVQVVREYRNAVVHGGEAAVVTVPQARAWLCTFLGWMPPEW